MTVFAVALAPVSGCGLGGRGAEYSYDPWDVSASGSASPATDATTDDATTLPTAAESSARSASTGVSGGAGADAGGDVAALREQVRELRERERALLHALDDVRTDSVRESASGAQDVAASPVAQSDSDRLSPDSGAVSTGDTELIAERIAGLHAELAEERRRRQAAEMQLDRLRRETSLAPFSAPTVPESAFLAAKQEIVYLRQALTEEKLARQKLAEDFTALQRELARRPPADAAAADHRGAQLEARTGEAAASFQRTLAATEAESAALDRELAAAADAADDNTSAVRAENALLRQRLDEQRRRTQDLAAKLKLAVRVTDLIFKLEAQPRTSNTRPSRQTRSTATRAVKSRRSVPAVAPAMPAPAQAPAPAKAPPSESAPKPHKNAADPPYPI